LVRRANAAFRAGDAEAADSLYAAAEERAADPGLVAFNRAAVLFERGQFRDAERHYDRVLADVACPPERSAKAWYNRGTCLLKRGGSMGVYRSSVACFENTLDSPAADEPLKADARHNLELAKLLWLEEAKKEQKKDPPSPNDNTPPEEQHRPQPEPQQQPGTQEMNPGRENTAGTAPKPGSQAVQQADGSKPSPTEQNVAGNNPNLPVPKDEGDVQPLSPDDARAYLKETSKRRKRELRALLETLYGPDRVDVRDW
jgi:tetratricopeptide (TPR) repeat protein